MGLKEFSKELNALVERAVNEGVNAGHLNIVSMVGALEISKQGVINYATTLAIAHAQKQAADQQRIITPAGVGAAG